LTLAFQVALTPYSAQIGKTVVLIGEVGVIGQDKFTQDILSSKASEVDTTLPDDETITEQQGIVQ